MSIDGATTNSLCAPALDRPQTNNLQPITSTCESIRVTRKRCIPCLPVAHSYSPKIKIRRRERTLKERKTQEESGGEKVLLFMLNKYKEPKNL